MTPRRRQGVLAMMEPSAELDVLARTVIGAAMEVHKELGPGFLESVYEHALHVELELRSVPHRCQLPINVDCKGIPVGEGRLDFLVGEQLVVELKAVEALAPIHTA